MAGEIADDCHDRAMEELMEDPCGQWLWDGDRCGSSLYESDFAFTRHWNQRRARPLPTAPTPLAAIPDPDVEDDLS